MGLSDLVYVLLGVGGRRELARLTGPEFDRLLETGDAEGPAVLYKHSPRCIVCRRAIRHVEEVARSRPDLPVYVIDVLEQRRLSNRTARELDVTHESPQAIVLRGGRATWTASHWEIDEEALETAIGR